MRIHPSYGPFTGRVRNRMADETPVRFRSALPSPAVFRGCNPEQSVARK